MKGTVNSDYFKALIKEPLFFVRIEYQYIRNHEDYDEIITWDSVKKEISFSCPIEFIKAHSEFALLVLDNPNCNLLQDQYDQYEFSCHVANPQKDLIPIINSFVLRSQNTKDKFPFIYILWFLNYSDWNTRELKRAIEQYDSQTQNYICDGLSKFCRCLARYKQLQVKEVLAFFDYDYKVYSPSIIYDAFASVKPQRMYNLEKWNLFNLIDYIFDEDYFMKLTSVETVREVDTDSSNELLITYEWLQTNNALCNYYILRSVYPLVSNKIKHDIILRYFYDIGVGNTNFELDIMKQFLDSDYADFERYRYCINTPDCNVYLGNKLLTDCVLTLIRTEGRAFTDFEGVLDLAIKECNVNAPKIDLGLDSFLPRCDGGGVYNDDFGGFIDYCIEFSLDKKKVTDEKLLEYVKCVLKREGRKKKYYMCIYDQEKSLLSNESKCFANRSRLDCVVEHEYDDIWEIDGKWIEFFLDNSNSENCTEIRMNDISVENIKKRIFDIFSKYKKSDGTYYISSAEFESFKENEILCYFSIWETLYIYPIKQASIGYDINLFDIEKDDKNRTEENKNKFYIKESAIVMKLIVSSLKNILGEDAYNGEYFKLKYDKSLLEKLKRIYYVKNGRINYSQKEKVYNFLKRKRKDGISFFCAPRLSEIRNQAIDVPFFWCNGKECFRNALTNGTLSGSLFRIAEILGYPKHTIKEEGIEADESISLFIAIANKALRKFNQLKCRSCGHLMYPEKNDGFQRIHYYYCINPNCSDFQTPVYLNYCFNCKKGLIDSRDSKQYVSSG